MKDKNLDPKLKNEDKELELSLRPKKLAEFIGQEKMKEQLGVFIKAAQARGEPLDHILFYGPPGLGKTTLAMLLSSEMGSGIKITSGPALTRAGDLAFSAISTVVNEVFPRWNGVVEAEQELSNSFSGKLMDIGENIRAQVGVCEHMTLVAAYVMERLIDEGYLRGKVSVDRNYIPERKASHTWVRYTSKGGKVFILDIAKGVSGSMTEAMAKNKWDYRRPGEKVSTSFPLIKWW